MPPSRTAEEVRHHYEVEKALAARLRAASREERGKLYTSVYHELFSAVPSHPRLTRKVSPEGTAEAIAWQLGFLSRFLVDCRTFLEIGAGDCALSFAVARQVRRVYGLDVVDQVPDGVARPGNFSLLVSDGCSIGLETASVDVAYSNQLMEHLHPDDALAQLQSVHRVLRRGGVYVCVTPNKLSGPHDISREFDEVATGFHLREYTMSELRLLFDSVGFAKSRVFAGARGRYVRCPAAIYGLGEGLLRSMPHRLRKRVTRTPPGRLLSSIRIVGVK